MNGPGGAIANNNDWRDSQATEIQASQLAPSDDREAAIIATVAPGSYTAVVTGQDQTTGVTLVELYDLDSSADAKLANISTRGSVESGSNIMIGGFILGKGSDPARVIVRALGPSLASSGIADPLPDTFLELRKSNGDLVRSNNNWKDSQRQRFRQRAFLRQTTSNRPSSRPLRPEPTPHL